jgi:hypothetical protein
MAYDHCQSNARINAPSHRDRQQDKKTRSYPSAPDECVATRISQLVGRFQEHRNACDANPRNHGQDNVAIISCEQRHGVQKSTNAIPLQLSGAADATASSMVE